MARAGSTIANPRRKELVRFVKVAADTHGELLEMLVEAEPGGPPPPLHCHPRQEERFEVLAGRLAYRVGDREGVAKAGDCATVAPGVPHTWWNGGDDKLVMRGELRPALRFETFIETIYGLQRSGQTNRDGIPHPMQGAVLMTEFAGEWIPEFMPWPVRRLLPALAALGRARGLRWWYPEFSPEGPAAGP